MHVSIVSQFDYRVIKEALRSSGANATKKHLEDISMCGLFLLDVCKGVDGMFGVQCNGAHTTRDAAGGIRKIVSYLCEEKVTKEVKDRHGWPFIDPCIAGCKSVAEGKLDAYLRGEEDNIDEAVQEDTREIDVNYELSDPFFS